MILRILGILFAISVMVIYLMMNKSEKPTPQSSRWIKITSQGDPLMVWQGPWACIKDQNTGLLWENKTDSESIHDGYWTYSWWNNTQGEADQGDCYFESTRCDTLDLIRRTNREQLCGRSNWRLPTVDELKTLITLDVNPGEPAVDINFFPHTKHGDYWTSSSEHQLTGVFRHLKKGAIAINFSQGKSVILPYRNAAFVRLVSSSQKNKQELNKIDSEIADIETTSH